MNPQKTTTHHPPKQAHRRTVAAAAVLTLGLGATAVLGGPSALAADGASPGVARSSAPSTAGRTEPVPSDVVMVQANIKTGMTLNRFQSDVRTALAPRPDFVTYNEVPRRNDLVLAPAGYAIWRTPGEYTGAIPVVWREDTWTAIDQGTQRVSNYREIPKKRHTMLGLRYANWVTLTSVDGRTVSVISTHVPPLVKGMPDLRRATVKRIGKLVTELKSRGPVLVGGDFNLHFTSSAYPRDVLAADGMVPTYDALGSYFPTGDHVGATIDYIFATPEDQVQFVSQRAVEMYSDHDAVIAGLNWMVDAPAQTTSSTNLPGGTKVEKRRAVKPVLRTIRAALPGESVDVVTARLAHPRVASAIEAAAARGVVVRVITLDPTLSPVEQDVAAAIGTTTGTGPGLRQCLDACADAWTSAAGPVSLVLHKDGAGTPLTRVDVNGYLDLTITTEVRQATEMTGRFGLGRAVDLLSALDATATPPPSSSPSPSPSPAP